MENIPRFKETCSYCYTGIEDSLTFCCSIPLCTLHMERHVQHTPIFTIQKKAGTVFIESSILNDEEKEDIKKHIISYQSIEIDEKKNVRCPHLQNIVVKKLPNAYNEIICMTKNCGIKDKIYICLSCGYLGCPKVQYGILGNGHAFDHKNESDHFITTLYEDLRFDGSNKTYCYLCDDFIYVENIRSYLSALDLDYTKFLNLKQTENIIQKNKFNSTNDCNTKQRYFGIINHGNTCYISAVLHMISLNNSTLTDHFLICYRSPLECFICQFIKVINTLHSRILSEEYLKDVNFLNILDLVEKIEYEFPIFQRPYQQDTNEFLLFIFMKLKEYELIGEIPLFVDDYLIKTCNKVKCKSCDVEGSSTSDLYSLNLEFDKSISSAIKNFLIEKHTTCICNGSAIDQNMILATSKYLIIVINRIMQGENNSYSKMMENVEADQIICINENTRYRNICNILHRGESLVTGHYVAEYDGFVFDDERVLLKDGDNGQGYIFLYEKIY